VLIFLGFTVHACGIVHYNVKGRVVDAQTQKPIKDAAIAIHWSRQVLFPFPPGLDSGYRPIGTYEAQSDANGLFEIPKYIFQNKDMGVYKKGYIGWFGDFIFPKVYKKPYEIRNFKVENGMVIQLEPIESLSASPPHTIEYVRAMHACYCDELTLFTKVTGYSNFRKVISEEHKNCLNYIRTLK
jgi:hypothetical protein